MKEKTRIEEDFIGSKEIPANVYYGINAARAYDNFFLTGKSIPFEMIKAFVK